MAQITNINAAPLTTPEDAKFIVLKNGKFNRCDLNDVINKINTFNPANINKSFEEAGKLINALEDKIAALQDRVVKLEKINDKLINNKEVSSENELAENETKNKSSKKSKKSE